MNRKIKWITMALALLLFVIFGIKATSISDRAIVLALAIDKKGDGYEVTAQVLVPSSSDAPKTNAEVSTVFAPTLSGAFNMINKQTGLLGSLSHCNLIIFGEDTIKDEVYGIMDYMIRNSYLSENAMLAACEGTAKEILTAKVVYSEMASLYIQRTILQKGDYEGVVKCTIKEFVVGYNTHSTTNWLPYIKKVEAESPKLGSEQGQGGDKSYVFDLSGTAIMKDGTYVFTTDEKQTDGLSLYTRKLQKGAIDVEGDNGEKIETYLLESKPTVKFDSDKLAADVEIELKLQIKEILTAGGAERESYISELSPSETERLKANVAERIKSLYEECAEYDVDVLGLYEGFDRAGHKKWEQADKTDYLKKASVNVSVKVDYQ